MFNRSKHSKLISMYVSMFNWSKHNKYVSTFNISKHIKYQSMFNRSEHNKLISINQCSAVEAVVDPFKYIQ